MFVVASCIIQNYILYNYVIVPVVYNVGGYVIKTLLVNTLPEPVTNVLCLHKY